jgi:hypothetical protein
VSLLAACDLGPARNESPALVPVELVAAGTNIGPGQSFTIDQPIRLAFSRFLNPASVVRQSIYLEDSGGSILTDELVAYDPVLSTVTLSNPGSMLKWLTVGQQYRVVLNVPDPEAGFPYGVVALDGAPLAAPQTLLFTVGAAASPPATGDPRIQFCAQVLPIFNSHCASCHGTPGGNSYSPSPDGGLTLPRDALILSTVDGIRATAIGQVADESNTGPLAAPQSYPLGTPFGLDMPIINPGDPGNSWLLYKTLIPQPTPSAEDPDSGIPMFEQAPPTALTQALASDRTTLQSYILGNSMPYPVPTDAGALVYPPLTLDQLETLRAWIAQGATFDQDPCP